MKRGKGREVSLPVGGGEEGGRGGDNGAWEPLISPVSPAGNRAGCKHCSGECWRVITG